MRILFINKATLRHEGGAEIRSREVGKRFVAMGHEVVVFTARTRIEDPLYEVFDGMKIFNKKILPDWLIRRFPAPHYLPLAAANLFLIFPLYFFLKKEKFDLIREDISPFPTLFLLSMFRFSSAKRMAIVHNPAGALRRWVRFYGFLYGVVGFIFDRLLRTGKLKYDQIVCVSLSVAKDLKKYSQIREKVRWVPNGVNRNRFQRKEKSTSKSEEIRLLSVGRLVGIKGHQYLIEALSFLKPEYPKVRLTIFGSGPLKTSLMNLAKQLRVENQVIIRSPVSYEEMPQVYANEDYFVLPSLSEGLSLTLLEAMANELPIVGTKISGIQDVLDVGMATFCSSGNAQDLAEKLKWAFEHPDEIKQKSALAALAVKKYNWDSIAQQEIA